MRSQSGCVIGIGLGPIYAKSSAQKLNTKSSTESELVALSDNTSQVIWCRNFLTAQGYNLGPATIYQDNMSTISMVANGKSNSARTRHIAIRFFFIADRVKTEMLKLNMKTGNKLADILTKPLQGQLFLRLRGMLLNWD
jgi:ABC-type transport system involved in Fe-S cluster assembly fused permease/ATPase subunit